jgi:ATP-dependent DNA ligase
MDTVKDIIWIVIAVTTNVVLGLYAFFKVQADVANNSKEISEIKAELKDHDKMIENKLDGIRDQLTNISNDIVALKVGKQDK